MDKRVIKFRARVSGNWVYWEITGQKPVGIDKNTITQYIGIKDKKGKEIYEGDIVLKRDSLNSDGRKVTVEWRSHLLYDLEQSDLEIIGNIYESKL